MDKVYLVVCKPEDDDHSFNVGICSSIDNAVIMAYKDGYQRDKEQEHMEDWKKTNFRYHIDGYFIDGNYVYRYDKDGNPL